MKQTKAWLITVSAAVLFGNLPFVLLAQTYTEITLNDIVGVPSRIPIARATQKALRLQRKALAHRQEQLARLLASRERNRQRLLALLPMRRDGPSGKLSRKNTVTSPTKKIQTVHPVAVPVAAPRQTVLLTFVTAEKKPAAGISITATIHARDLSIARMVNLTTNTEGQVRLENVGPFPCTVDVSVPDDASDTSGATQDARKAGSEWQVASPQTASLLLDRFIGERKIAKVASLGIRVASATIKGRQKFLPPSVASRTAFPAATAITYEWKAPEPVVLERLVTDLAIVAPSGSTVTSPALPGQVLQVPDTGRLLCHVPVGLLVDGPLPLRVQRTLTGGDVEAVIDDYPIAPYAESPSEQKPQLRLVRTAKVTGVGLAVLTKGSDNIARVLGKLPEQGKGKKNSRVRHVGDGAEWWDYRQPNGVLVKVRRLPSNELMVERVRVVTPSGGSVGPIRVGTTVTALQEALGMPDQEDPQPHPYDPDPEQTRVTVHSYLTGGIRVGVRDGIIQWIELARSTLLLQQGTTAFVPPSPVPLYVEPFESGDPKTQLGNTTALTRYLKQLPAVVLVDHADAAELILATQGATFTERRDSFLIKNLPFQYRCETTLHYTLRNAETGAVVGEEHNVKVSAGADYRAEAIGGALLIGILAKQKGDLGKIAAGLLGVAGVAELQRSIGRAVNRCPALTARGVFAQLSQDVGRAADFRVAVTAIDYEHGRLHINAGKRQGLVASTAAQPCEFELMVGNQPLPGSESGLSADYYTAVVLSADEDSAVCELRHIKRQVKEGHERNQDTLARDMIQKLPDPVTGIVSARALVRFPSLALVAETGATEADVALPQGEPNSPSGEAPPTRDRREDTLLDHLFKPRKH